MKKSTGNAKSGFAPGGRNVDIQLASNQRPRSNNDDVSRLGLLMGRDLGLNHDAMGSCARPGEQIYQTFNNA